MAEPKTEQEPSIEEILDSIRQIISDEGDTAAAPAATAPAPANVASAAGKPQSGAPAQKPVAAAPSAARVAPVPSPAAPAADILDLTEKINAGSEIDLIDKPMTMEKLMTEKPDSLMSPQTADAATEALSKLLAGSLAVEKDETARNGKVTLEDMTLDLMKPLLKAWLDQNLPGLIEKIVQKEVEKLSRRALDR